MDPKYMEEAISLALKGWGWTSPNPLVGAVIVKNDRVIGRGYHERYGDLHAERNALKNCTESPAGADMYVTLEPCSHHGKQPPCTEALIEAGIKRVFIGSIDPNPLVAGKGISKLRDHGIEVTENVLKEKCDEINDVFFHFIQNKTPFVVMKYAMTLDGKIAAYTGESKWITGEKARENVQRLRGRYRGIMVGIGTVLADDPMLTCRMEGGRNPVRIVCDTRLRIPMDSKLVATAKDVHTIIATSEKDEKKHLPYKEMGCEIVVVSMKDSHVDLKELMGILGSKNIDSVLIEGGAELNWSVVENKMVNKVYTYIAPKLIGGEASKGPVGGRGFPEPGASLLLEKGKISCFGDDYLIESRVK